jgi:hypothetical protein
LDGPDSLKNKVKALLESEDAISAYKQRIAETKKSFIRTWQQRFDEEYRLLGEIVASKQSGVKSRHPDK